MQGFEGTYNYRRTRDCMKKQEVFASDRERNPTHSVNTHWIKDPADPHRCFYIFWLIRLLFWLKLADLLYTANYTRSPKLMN